MPSSDTASIYEISAEFDGLQHSFLCIQLAAIRRTKFLRDDSAERYEIWRNLANVCLIILEDRIEKIQFHVVTSYCDHLKNKNKKYI